MLENRRRREIDGDFGEGKAKRSMICRSWKGEWEGKKRIL
jgi:hypothetical protein